MLNKILLATLVLGFCAFPLAGHASEDTAAPNITAFNLTPDTVDTAAADQTLTLTLTLTDNQAGVCIPGDCDYNSSQTQLRLDSPDGLQSVSFTDFTRTSGNDLAGTYVSEAVLPRYSLNGVWSTGTLLLVDKLGNYIHLSNDDLETAFGNGVSDVENTALVYDASAPEVTAFALSPQTVNTDVNDADITLTLTLTDDLTGVCVAGDGCGAMTGETQLRLIAPNGSQDLVFIDLTRTSGDELNGAYSGTMALPVGSVPGTWTVAAFSMYDRIGNASSLDKDALETTFGAGIADIINTATSSDEEHPQITAFDITPTEINTDDSGQVLTLTMTLTDNAAGVCIPIDCGDYYNSSETQLRLRPLIGTQSVDFTSLTRLSGDSLSGVYQASATVPMSSKEGLWQVDHLLLVDKLGNHEYLYADDLNGLFPDASGITITNTALASSITIEREWTLSSASATVTFPVNTVVTKREGGSFAFYRMVNQAFNIETLPDENLGGTPVATIRFGIPGLNLDFSQNVAVAMTVGSEYTGQTLMIQALGEGGEAWANEASCIVADGQCSFTVNHATYFTAAPIPQSTLLVSAKAPGGPQVTTWNGKGKKIASFMAFTKSFRGGVTTAMGDLNGDGKNEIVVVPYSAGKPQVRVFDAKGNFRASVFPYSTSYRGGLSLALGDVDADGNLEIIVAPSTGGGPQVRVFDYKNKVLTKHGQWFAYPFGLRTGISVQAGDTDGDNKAEVVAATNTGATPHVRVFSGKGKLEGQFYAFPKSFKGGVNATVADINADGKADIIASPKAVGKPQVRAYSPKGHLMVQFFAYPSDKRLGVKTGVGDVDGNGNTEIITAPQSGNPQIRIFKANGKLKDSFLAYDKTFKGGVELVVGNVDTDGPDEIIAGPKADGGPNVKIFNGDQAHKVKNIMALASGFRGGVNITLSQ